ncbi:MAG: FAD-dependent monooxygenase [Hyphomicrobiales bacterium]|nr:FAD-dependent monooxygenase [Hyphomicrobiales bacterium]
MVETKRIAVIGGGIGGLTAAIALRRRGFEVIVYEQAEQLGEIGAGVQLSPNAMRVLIALGLDAAFEAAAFEPNRHVVRNWKSGAIVSATQMKGVFRAQYGAGYFGAHRADLHTLLAQALPATCIALSARCTGISQSAEGVTVAFADGRSATADAAVGADGIRSAVRESLFGPDAPRFTGHIVWRGLVPSARLPAGLIEPDMTAWFGPKGTVVHYYVRRGELVNWIAHFETDWRNESWSVESDWREAAQAFDGWHPTLAALFSRTERCYKWALYDRDPLPRWTQGRVTLLGDAAHPMLPYLAQGAGQAIEDGYVLADRLAQHRHDAPAALAAYEAARRPRTARIQLHARERGKINNASSVFERFRRDLGYRIKKFIRPKEHTYSIEWIYGHDVTAARGEAKAA